MPLPSENCVAVDLGGTNLRCGIVAPTDEVVAYERTPLDDGPATRSAAIWDRIVGTIVQFVAKHAEALSRTAPIAVAFPGPVLDDRVAGQAPTVAGAARVPDIVGELRGRTARDVVMLNDVSAAAWYFERRVTADRFAVVTVSSGIGFKIFDRHSTRGVLDDTSYAGEIGHLIVDPSRDALICDCGGSGHLGAIASGRGFERHARREAQRDAAAFRASACAVRYRATAATLINEVHLAPAIAEGDEWALGLLRTSVNPLAEVLRTLTIGCGLQHVVIMGGFAQRIGPAYERALTSALGTFSDRGSACVRLENFVSVASQGDEPGLIGAARYAQRRRALGQVLV